MSDTPTQLLSVPQVEILTSVDIGIKKKLKMLACDSDTLFSKYIANLLTHHAMNTELTHKEDL